VGREEEGSEKIMIYKRGDFWHMDVTVNGVRYREALDTSDKREALRLEKERVKDILQGKGATLAGRDFARKPFSEAVKVFLDERKGHVSARTLQIEEQRLRPLKRFFGDRPVIRIKAEEIATFQRSRLENGKRGKGASHRTVNMETGVLRRLLKRAKAWNVLSEDVRYFPENNGVSVARVLTAEHKKLLFETAAHKEEWLVAFCAAVLAVSTTCRGMELKHLRWRDVDLFDQVASIRRSKTHAGHRALPLNADAQAALARLRERAEALGSSEPDHFVFPACENGQIDPNRPQKSWRSAWRSLVMEAAKRAGNEAAKDATENGKDPEEARKRGALAFISDDGQRLRFHDLRHQAITELAEGGASDATLKAVAGHLSQEMLEHYSHVRMAAKRTALDKLSGGLIAPPACAPKAASKAVN